MLIVKTKSILFTQKKLRYGSDKGSVKHGHTDGRTNIHGGKNNMSPAG